MYALVDAKLFVSKLEIYASQQPNNLIESFFQAILALMLWNILSHKYQELEEMSQWTTGPRQFFYLSHF